MIDFLLAEYWNTIFLCEIFPQRNSCDKKKTFKKKCFSSSMEEWYYVKYQHTLHRLPAIVC